MASDGLGPLEKSRAAALASPAAGALGAYVAHAADALRPKARVGLAQDADYLLGGVSCLLYRWFSCDFKPQKTSFLP